MEVVDRSWNQSRPPELMAIRLAAKLNTLKGDLKVWHAQAFGKLEGRINAQVKVLRLLDFRAEGGPLSPADSEARFKGFHDLWALLIVRESQLFQQLRSRWLREGDANSAYFHASIKARRRGNSILALKVRGRWVERVREVRAEIVDYFRNHFSEAFVDCPTIDGVAFPCISEVVGGGMVVPFSEEEIRSVVVEFDGVRSPSPDGFNFSFYKRFWDLLKGEVGIMFNQFFHSATLPQSFSSYFITLIPKVPFPILGSFKRGNGIFGPFRSLGPSISWWLRLW